MGKVRVGVDAGCGLGEKLVGELRESDRRAGFGVRDRGVGGSARLVGKER